MASIVTYLGDTDPEAALAPLQQAACTYRIALGRRAGQKVLTLQTLPNQAAVSTPQRCVNEQGFSLSSNTYAATSPGRPLPTNDSNAIARAKSCCNSKAPIRRDHPYRDVAARVHATPGRARPTTTAPSHSLPRCACRPHVPETPKCLTIRYLAPMEWP